MFVLFWDIDGTLLTTRHAGLAAFDQACREVLALEAIDWSRVDMRGFTDRSIAQRVLAAHGKPADDASIDRLLSCYESHLPARLAEREGTPMPGVVEVLEHLKGRSDVLQLLLTGNTRGGARAKLERCGLLPYFVKNGDGLPFGAFAEEGVLRDAIARAALSLAHKTAGSAVPSDRCFVIGDTPHDVSCGKAIGARTVAVATGGYTHDELHACEPWLLWKRVPAPDTFTRSLGL